MAIRNLHVRHLPVDENTAGALIDSLASPHDRLWAHDEWPEMRFDGPLTVGASGGHGPIRYRIVGYAPGRWIQFRFTAPRGFDGIHEFTVHPEPDGTALHHLLSMHARGPARITWPLVWRPLHDAVLEDSLDRAERATTATVRSAARWSWWVRMLRALASASPRLRSAPPA
ncbi:SRPBCC family protein [Saccharopolyspora sp. K220]|uniref:SRPBCC family protein n=1 Tax=Saccharopolyspora soli TaxID=2926618 RepID=UPI001F59B6BE|nr:SRPBCC family protein [Saccharopolyspora soli]MCI2422574.1 SRPBCC family protein [Saccharopolyspora soli]